MRGVISHFRVEILVVIVFSTSAFAGARIGLYPVDAYPLHPNQVVTVNVYLADTGNPQGNISFRGLFLDMADSTGTLSNGCVYWENPFGIGEPPCGGCGCWPNFSWVYPLPTPNPLFQITMPDNGQVLIAHITLNLGAQGGILDVMNPDNPDPNYGARADFGFGGAGDPITTWRAYTGELTGGWIDLRINGDEPRAIVASDPPSEAIDARQPIDPASPSTHYGWQQVDLYFDGQAPPPEMFDYVTGIGYPFMEVSSATALGQTGIRLQLAQAIQPGAWTIIRYLPSGWQTRIGYLPGDVDGNRTSSPADILHLIDALNGVTSLPIWSTDINRSGLMEPSDILREIDLLNGAGAFDVWNGETLPN